MMADMFKLEICLDSQSMTEFGQYVSFVGCEFPVFVQGEAETMANLLSEKDINLTAIRGVLSRLIDLTRRAVTAGDGVATLIGISTPVRIDGGPMQ